MKSLCEIVVFGFLIISQSYADLNIDDFLAKKAFDTELHERVLDSEMCKKQLDYIFLQDTSLLLSFLDAGPRIPQGILTGNLKTMGNYYQCLAIHKSVDDNMEVDGKYCTIDLPLNQNFNELSIRHLNGSERLLPNWRNVQDLLKESEEKFQAYRGRQSSLRKYILYQNADINEEPRADALPALEFHIGLCIPKPCTTQEALDYIFEVSNIITYKTNRCRLPNDKPWVAADYVAIAILSVIGGITLLSTCYDIYHLYVLNKSPKEPHNLRIFSAYTNIINVMDTTSRPGTLQCLDGVRALAMFWVILGHTFYFSPFSLSNLLDVSEWSESLRSVWVTGALYTVDTFFMMSGLLLVYVSMGKFKSGVHLLKNLPAFYLNRLLRMFPILATMILFKASFYNRLSDGPFWENAAFGTEKCRAYWWVTLLHLQNFLTPNESCVPVTWYLAIDVQLHILSPLVLFWLLRGKKTSAWGALVISTIISLAIATTYIFLVDYRQNNFAIYYVNILTRSPPFFVGMIVGYCLRLFRNQKLQIPAILSAIITGVCLGITFLMLYVDDEKQYRDVSVLYQDLVNAFSRSIWSASLGWIIFACANGHGGPINYVLTMNIWKIPSKVSYAMYIIHAGIIISYYSSLTSPLYFTVPNKLFLFSAFLAITIVLSVLVTALIDAPFSTIFRMILEIGSKKLNTTETTAPKQTEEMSKDPEKPVLLNGNHNKGFVADEDEKVKTISNGNTSVDSNK